MSSPRPHVIYLVRHAAAQERTGWSGPDALRPLTEEGLAQAERLALTLAAEGLQRVSSSPAVRCTQTVAPLATRLGLAVEETSALAEGARAEAALRWLAGLDNPSIAACTHGDVLEDLMQVLDAQHVLPEGRARYRKASTWVLRMDGPRVVHAEYRPPP